MGFIVYADGIPPYTFDISQGDITIAKDTGNKYKSYIWKRTNTK